MEEIKPSTNIFIESIMAIAKNMGILNLNDEAAKSISDSAAYRLKIMIQESKKHMMHSKRRVLLTSDVDNAFRVLGIEPTYRFHSKNHIPFKFSSGNCGLEFDYSNNPLVELNDFVKMPLCTKPLDIAIQQHWLAIEGVQTTVPENPPLVSKNEQKSECVNPLKTLRKTTTRELSGQPTAAKLKKLQVSENSSVIKDVISLHGLSAEQQIYFREITEACIGTDENWRSAALQSLSLDPGICELLPRLASFIAEGVKINVPENNLAVLIYLMRMVKSLLQNPNLNLEKYLHQIIPCVITCIVSKQMCLRPEIDNHWALRDFASRLVSQICKSYDTATNKVQTRITRIYANAVISDDYPLTSVYGALQGLSELGGDTVRIFVIPGARGVCDRLDRTVTTDNNIERISVYQIKMLLSKIIPPVLSTLLPPPYDLDEFVTEFGSIGTDLHVAMCKKIVSGEVPVPSFAYGLPVKVVN